LSEKPLDPNEQAAIAAGFRAALKRDEQEAKTDLAEAILPPPEGEPPATAPIEPTRPVNKGNVQALIDYRKKVESGEVFRVLPGQRRFRNSADVIRVFLESRKKGALDENGQNRLARMVAKMYEVATSDSPRNIEAFKALMERAYGRPSMAEEDRDAVSRGGVQIVYVAAPEVAEGEQRKALPSKPEFLEAEFTDD
jgi:hypothetical protein